MADTMMDHLPPTGWADVARKSDIDHLAALMDARFAGVDYRIDSFETRLDARFAAVDARMNGLVQGMWAFAGLSVAVWGAMFAVIFAKF